ncbi:DEAD/DEAH box helicase [Bordetella muralis]|jgi:ATP-dependent helicase Lhr and Lhr-like helicase|uniref:DEAD/DEAH box helicase n=1 Tax=Bordetella muralis TaxID=1649130 RepID=UPI0039EE520B
MTGRPRRWDAPLAAWFQARGWKAAAFQREVWQRYLAGESGVLHTPTGSGKTLAAFGGPVLEALAEPVVTRPPAAHGPRVLWVTPLRALAADTTQALAQVVTDSDDDVYVLRIFSAWPLRVIRGRFPLLIGQLLFHTGIVL